MLLDSNSSEKTDEEWIHRPPARQPPPPDPHGPSHTADESESFGAAPPYEEIAAAEFIGQVAEATSKMIP
jgi:hypothetical protein